MSRRRPTMSCTSSNEQINIEPERNLMDLISDWKTKSRMDSQYDRIKKILFSFNHKPTDFKPSDFFPPISDSQIASDSEEKTIDRADKERKSFSKRKLDYDNLLEIEEIIENQKSNEQQLNGSSSINENEKQRRQPVVTNEVNDLNQFSPINSPTKTNRNLIKLNRASILKQLPNDENIPTLNQINVSLSKKSISSGESSSSANNNLSPDKNLINSLQNQFNDEQNDQAICSNEQSSIQNESHSTTAIGNKSMNRSRRQNKNENEKENLDQKSLNPEVSLFEPPTPPSIVQQNITKNNNQVSEVNERVARSSITITKRRSAEPVRDILVDLSSNVSSKPKNLHKQKATTSKINESINDSQSELLNSQSSTFIRRKSTLSNKTSQNSLAINSSASVLFKPIKSIQSKNDVPPPPLFRQDKKNKSIEHETSSDENSFEIKQKKHRHKKSSKKTLNNNKNLNKDLKQDQVESLNRQSAEKSKIDQIINLEQNDQQEQQQYVHLDVDDKNQSYHLEHEIECNQSEIDANRNNKITSFLISNKKIDKTNDDLVDNKNKRISRKEIVDHSPKDTKTTKDNLSNKSNKTRKPLKNIQNQEANSQKAKTTSSRKEVGYFNNNKTIPYENKMNDECENEPALALRRSKRAKIDKNSQPIYGYEEISDYKGNKCIVRKVIGTKDKIDIKINKELMRINHYLTDNANTKEKKKKRNEAKNVDKTQTKISDAFKKLEKTQNEKPPKSNKKENNDKTEEQNRSNLIIELDLANDQVQNENLNQNENVNNANIDESSLSLSMTTDNVNNSMEFIFSKSDGCTKPIHLYFFHKNIEKKNFQPYSRGVQICPISDLTGILRINGSCSSKTNYHDFAVNYFVQNGTFLFSLNGLLSIHHEKDVIYIPKSNFIFLLLLN